MHPCKARQACCITDAIPEEAPGHHAPHGPQGSTQGWCPSLAKGAGNPVWVTKLVMGPLMHDCTWLMLWPILKMLLHPCPPWYTFPIFSWMFLRTAGSLVPLMSAESGQELFSTASVLTAAMTAMPGRARHAISKYGLAPFHPELTTYSLQTYQQAQSGPQGPVSAGQRASKPPLQLACLKQHRAQSAQSCRDGAREVRPFNFRFVPTEDCHCTT